MASVSLVSLGQWVSPSPLNASITLWDRLCAFFTFVIRQLNNQKNKLEWSKSGDLVVLWLTHGPPTVPYNVTTLQNSQNARIKAQKTPGNEENGLESDLLENPVRRGTPRLLK